MASEGQSQVYLPRVAIKFCVQCKWNLRAAYYAQELLQTFSTSLGEVSLIPVTGGIFTITISYTTETSTISDQVLWDRKTEGGFPETKELKNRVRNIVEPDRDLGHIDRSLKKGKAKDGAGETLAERQEAKVGVNGGEEDAAPEQSTAAPDQVQDSIDEAVRHDVGSIDKATVKEKCEDCS